MDWGDTAEQAAFRAEVREFVEARLPERYRNDPFDSGEHFVQWVFDRYSEEPELREAAREWASALAERGWVAPAWPAEYGGAGLTSIEQFVFGEEMARAHAPPVGGNGVVMLGPTLIVHGSEAQRREVLPRMLAGDYVYAQGYSEPGAGSDLASLATRAERDGDEYVINGQKIWTSGAHHADALFMLVRTDPAAPKHRGISFLLVPKMDTPGIEVRPLLDMTYGHYFNEVFFENVRVPVAQRVGEENRGWYVGMTLLDFERSGVAGAVAHEQNVAQLARFLASAEGAAYRRTGGWASARAELAERWIEAGVSRQLSLRIASMQAAGLTPNQEASMGKLFSTELGQRIARTGMRALGLHGLLWRDEPRAPLRGNFTYLYVRLVPITISGGSSEIQRNIIATRGLGLPRG